jgi:hypothetical protein
MEEFGKRRKNAIIEDRSEAVKEIIKDHMKEQFNLWRCTTALTRLSAKNGSLKPLRREGYDFTALIDSVPYRD